ncbi:MAG: 4Fe-4S binding protein [Solitalea-like symbiont of Tyrophagus putrescentiae]
MGYFNSIIIAAKSLYKAIKITSKVVKQPSATLCYPKEKPEIPDNGRYELYVYINDCIGCDLCSRICPVDCIDIETHKADDVIGYTSDGSKKRLYIDKFDLNMAKCMFCGLCTIVCPTECIIMTKNYDNTVNNLSKLNYNFLKETNA